MDRFSKSERTWSDDELKDVVVAARNWRDVMRALGLRADSAGAIRIMKRHVLLHTCTKCVVGNAAGLMAQRLDAA